MAKRGTYNLRKKIINTHKSISTAYHEAGHAIYGLLKGFKVDTVFLFKNTGGLTVFLIPPVDDPEIKNSLIKSEICLRYAGLVAEKCQFKKVSGADKFPLFLKDGSSNDTFLAAKLIKDNNIAPPGKKRYLLKKKLIQITQEEIEEHWEAVTLVAHALFKKKKINFEDLKKILTKSPNTKNFWKERFINIEKFYVDFNEDNIKLMLNT